MAAVCQVIWVTERLKLPSCCVVIYVSIAPLAVDKVLAAADELQAYFRGYFVFACRTTKWQQLGNHK